MSVRVCDTCSHFPQTRKMSFTFENPHWCLYTDDYKIFNWNHFTGFFSLLSCDSSTERTFCNDLFEYCTADIYMALCIQMTFTRMLVIPLCFVEIQFWIEYVLWKMKTVRASQPDSFPFQSKIEHNVYSFISNGFNSEKKWIEQVEKNNMKSETEYQRCLLKNRNFSSLHLHLNSSANTVATRCLAGEKVAFYWSIVHYLNDMAE